MPPLSPSVLTSTAAQNHIDTVVKPTVQSATATLPQANTLTTPTNPNNVSTPTTSPTSQAPSTSVNAPQNTYSYIATDGTQKTIQASTPTEAMSKAGDIAAHSGVQAMPAQTSQTPTTSNTSTTNTSQTPSGGTAPSDALSSAQSQLDQANADYQAQAKSVQDAITGITNGSVPLSPAEQAQVAGLQAQFDQLIQQQTQVNTSAVSVANVRGYQTGSAEYDPSFQVKTIGGIVTAGQQKIFLLQQQEAAALAGLTTQLKNNDIAGIKDAWSVYQDAQSKKQDAIQNTIDAATKAIADAQAAQQKQVDSVNSIAEEAAKNGAPPSVLSAITASGTEADALTAAADYMQTASGTQGDYLLYVRQAKAAGQVPVDYNTYLNMDANRKVKASTGGSGTGSLGGSSGSPDNIELIAQAIENGHQPPVTTGLYGNTAAVRAQLEKDGYDYTKANQDWTATQKLLGTLNGAQQTRLRQAVNQVSDSLDLTQSLADQWNGGGFPALNSATLASAKAGALGPDAQSLATRLDAQIADVTSELGTVYKGGNSSTDESLKLAAQNLQSNWSKQTFDDAIAQAKQNIQIRQNSLNLTTAGVTDSNYNPTNATLLQQGAQNPLQLAPTGTDSTKNPLGI